MAIARRLCSGTPVLLADEHTGNLDGENTRIVMDIKGKTRTRVQEDKDKLAEIASRAVQFAGDAAGTHACMYSGGDVGIHNMILMTGETLDLLQDDKELMQLAKEKYEARDKMYCEELNKQVKPYAQDGKAPLKPRTFRENLEKIRSIKAFHEIEQKGMDAVVRLEKANEADRVMDAAEKRECIRDILKCRIFAGIYRQEIMEQDELEKLDTEELAETLRVGFKTKDIYTGEKLILRSAMMAEAEKGNREKTKQLDREKASAENAASSNNGGIRV